MAIKLTQDGLQYSDGSTQYYNYENYHIKRIDAFPSDEAQQRDGSYSGSYTWTKQNGDRMLRVIVTGAGGGGCGHGESGGAGGYAEKWIDVSAWADGTNVAVTVGGRGGGTGYHSGAGRGGTSSFGSYVSASGGHGANTSHSHTGGFGGVGSGGDINLYGGGGRGHTTTDGAQAVGGKSYWGGGSPASWPTNSYTHYQEAHGARGAGGTAERRADSRGGHGQSGFVVVYVYGND